MAGSSSGAQSTGGTPSSGGSNSSGGTLGDAGAAASGEPSLGGTSGSGGGSNGGTAGSTGGGGGTDTTCSPPCMAPNQFCEGTECKCSSGYTPCETGCFDLQNDKAHCGACDATCEDGCSVGRCFTELVAFDKDDNIRLTVDNEFVYYTMQTAGAVYRVSRTGVVTQVAADQVSPQGIAVDVRAVYWVTNFEGNVMKKGLAPGDPVTTIAQYQGHLVDVATDTQSIYWLSQGSPPGIQKCALTQCATPVAVVVGGDEFSKAPRFTFDGSYVYWAYSGTTSVSGFIQKAPLDGGTQPTTLAMIDNPRDVAVSAGNVYFGGGFDESTYGLRKVSTDGQGLDRLTMAQGEQVAADGSAVYFAYHDIVMVSLDGTTTTRLANEPVNEVLDLAVNGNDVFWATSRAIRFTSKR